MPQEQEGPDPVLSQIYGTAAVETEKTAESAIVEKLAAALEQTGTQFDALSEKEQDELIDAAVQDAEGQEGAEEEAEEGSEEAEEGSEEAAEEGEEKTAFAEKFAEADTMGRIMAHAYRQELSRLEKEAGVGDKAKAALGYLKGKGKGAYEAMKAHKGRTAAGAAALGGGAYAVHRMRKKSSVKEGLIEQLAEQRVAEILEELGVQQ